jgi:nicotinate-nucleotide adenylyltransferase
VRLGLFGGTFDPPHVGHLIVAQDAAVALGLDRVSFIPAAQPPHKQADAITPAALRARMLELAIAADARFALDPVELERRGPSYTVDTLRALRARQPDVELTLLIGHDQYRELDTWREPEAVLSLARLAVMTRGAVSDGRVGAVEPLQDGVVQVGVTRIDISSTQVRSRVRQGLPIRYLVAPAVEQFILENRLYGRNGIPVTG